MNRLWLYDRVSRFAWLNYRNKIMVMAFLGTHVPLLAIIALFALGHVADLATALQIIGVALVATLVGTGITLFVLNHLLRPILMTSEALRAYRTSRIVPDLPTRYTDEAGTLMADAETTLIELDAAIDDLAHYDKVSGLPNRARLLEECAAWIEAGRGFALCAVRSESYDRVVATFGQETADAMVRQLVAALRTIASPRTYVARVEGGTFAALIGHGGNVDDLLARIEAKRQALAGDIRLGEITVTPELRLGLALFPDDHREAGVLLDAALSALERAGGAANRIAFFSPVASEEARQRFVTEQELRRALARSEFTLHYQPVVNLVSGRATGAEALIRWNHPERGLLAPAAFIPIAESAGLIDDIGLWVMRRACAQMNEWKAAGLDDLSVAVNISARQFRQPGLVDLIGEALRDNRVDPGRFEIELTESEAMRDRAYARKLFGSLRDLGVNIAIDDFGTGYSSLSQLKDLPFTKLKIDREFVSRVETIPSAQAICAAIIALTRGLGIDVLAEGAETAEEVRYLHEHGCHLFQGFYFARPMPPEAFAEAVGSVRLGASIVAAAA